MKKFVSTIIFAILTASFIFLGNVYAASVNTTVRGAISIYYTKGGYGFEGLEINAYRVAKMNSDGSFELLAPFTEYPVSVEEMLSETEWKSAAETLAAYVKADQLESYCMIGTDETGTVVMDNMETGLYLIPGVMVTRGEETCQFADFFVSLPSRGIYGGYNYQVEVKPKSTLYVPPQNYKVVKLWKDADYTAGRPNTVEVDILKDSVVSETVILNADNNWSYEWQVPSGDGNWTVVEKNVAENYQVEIVNQNDTFQIINTYVKKEETKPQKPNSSEDEETNGSKETEESTEEIIPSTMPPTGDQAPTMLYTLILCISGVFLFIFGIYRSRRK